MPPRGKPESPERSSPGPQGAAGRAPSTEQLVGRLPEWRNELKALMDCHRLLQQTPDEAHLSYALDRGGDPAVVHYNLALAYLSQGDRRAALASVRRALQADSRHRQARAVYERLQREGEPRPPKPADELPGAISSERTRPKHGPALRAP